MFPLSNLVLGKDHKQGWCRSSWQLMVEKSLFPA